MYKQLLTAFFAFPHADRAELIRALRHNTTTPKTEIGVWYTNLPSIDAKARFAALVQTKAHRVKHDSNGNPRCVISWIAVSYPHETYSDVINRYRGMFKRYRGKDFGGGLVIQAYDTLEVIDAILRVELKTA